MAVYNRLFIAIFEVLYLPALLIIVLCYWFLFVYVFHIIELYLYIVVLYANIDQSLVNSLHGLLICEIRLACYYNRV